MAQTAIFSIRAPKDLIDQIEARAKINRRSRNGEIIHILEQAIERSVEQTLAAMPQESPSRSG